MKIGILGAGFAGLSVGYFLKKSGCDSFELFESSDVVGGLARSFKWHGFDCDLAPHRLYTDDDLVRDELLSLTDMSQMRRHSQIFIRGKWIQDPVNAIEVILKFLPRDSFRIAWHYLFRQKNPETNFENLVLNQFGKGLNELFFKPYSEKLFGIPADEISAIWGKRKLRVGGLKDIIRRNSRLYFKDFYYPVENGYGAIAEALHAKVKSHVQRNTRLINIEKSMDRAGYLCTFQSDGKSFQEYFDVIVSSLPITLLLGWLGKPLKLRFQSAIQTYFLIDKPHVTKNHWFYISDSHFKINRVAEFKNFADRNAPQDKTVLCCEMTNTDDYSVENVQKELQSLGLIHPEEILDSKIVKIPHAYPIYDLDYENQMEEIKAFCARHPNVHFIGRNAQFLHQDVDEIFASGMNVAEQLLQQINSIEANLPEEYVKIMN
ncbi:MAG: hypothetical protein DWQ10_08105 [Calditrichaeota bacterium]|nr:MAG: hypothetical protein DWQ10_08105 [Calditrichota bacterium]